MAHANSFKSAALSSVLAILSMTSAHGATEEITVTRNPALHYYGWYTQLAPDNSGQLSLSPLFLSTLNAVGAQVSTIAPGTLDSTINSRNRYTSIQLDMPVTALFGNAPDNLDSTYPMEMSGFSLIGGLRIQTQADGLTNTGGDLSIYNLRLSLNDRLVYGDVEGGNGVGVVQHMALWNLDSFSGWRAVPSQEDPRCNGMICTVQVWAETSVDIGGATPQAFDVFTRSLGLMDDGVQALHRVSSYGGLTTSVPEPSSYLLMGLGLLGVGAAARRARHPV